MVDHLPGATCFRLKVDDVIVDEGWCPPEDPGAVARRQADIALQATADDKAFVLELYDPDLPPDLAMIVLDDSSGFMFGADDGDEERILDDLVHEYANRLDTARRRHYD